MTRLYVGLSIAVAAVLLVFVAFTPIGINHPLGRYLLYPALQFWYIGVAAILASWLLHRRRASGLASRSLGVVGVTWVAFVVGYYVVLLILVVAVGGNR